MNIGTYTFEEFKAKAAAFHGYPAPGLLIGGYMVELARRQLPAGTLFDAVSESAKCLPDAVQILTPCTLGNGWMRVLNLGRYALSLYDKYTGEGVRVWVDLDRLAPYEEIRGWFLKLKKKADQDTERLFHEIETAGETLCSMALVRVDDRFRKHKSMGRVGVCPICAEAYPANDGAICRGCQGEAPYSTGQQGCQSRGMAHGLAHEVAATPAAQPDTGPRLVAVPVAEAVGHKTLHDMTRIVPGESKGVEFEKGHAISGGDVCRLQAMGRAHVYLEQDTPDGFLHEDKAALAFAKLMAGDNVTFDEKPHEGKVNFRAVKTGVLVLERERLEAFNLVPDVMAATRHHGSLVEEGKALAGRGPFPFTSARRTSARRRPCSPPGRCSPSPPSARRAWAFSSREPRSSRDSSRTASRPSFARKWNGWVPPSSRWTSCPTTRRRSPRAWASCSPPGPTSSSPRPGFPLTRTT